jgi:hypothetical protein
MGTARVVWIPKFNYCTDIRALVGVSAAGLFRVANAVVLRGGRSPFYKFHPPNIRTDTNLLGFYEVQAREKDRVSFLDLPCCL